MVNPILGARRILKKGLHEEGVTQSNELLMTTFLASDKNLPVPLKLYYVGCFLSFLQKPAPVLCLSTKTDLNDRSLLPKRWRAEPVTKLTTFSSF